MRFLAISWAVFVFVLVVAIFQNKGKEWDSKERKIEFIKGKNENDEIKKELDLSFKERFIIPKFKFLSNFISKNNKANSNKTKQIENQLRLAGKKITVENFLFYKYLFMAATAIVAIFLAIIMKNVLLLLIGAFIIVLCPRLYLSMGVTSNQQAIRNQVPDALDLLCICVESGLSFDASLVKVAEKMEGPFIDELMKVYNQIQMGVPRTDALHSLADATEIEELKTFVAALAQASQLGIPINNVMRVQSEQLRETRMQMAKEKGMKAPVKMLIPMLLLIFPVIFIVLMAPTVINIMQNFNM